MKQGEMLNILEDVVTNLPKLLTNKHEWSSLNINDENPKTERIWRQFGDIRINLHRIFPSKRKPFFHPHPWPCSMVILKGEYEMALGYGNKKPPIISTCILTEGSRYEMVKKNAWHYVRPIKEKVYSIMISGAIWKRPILQIQRNLAPLSNEVFDELYEIFTQLIDEEVCNNRKKNQNQL